MIWRGLVIDFILLLGLGLLVSAVYEVSPLLARGGLGGVMFLAGLVGVWRRS